MPGFFGWVRRLFDGAPPADPTTARAAAPAAPTPAQRLGVLALFIGLTVAIAVPLHGHLTKSPAAGPSLRNATVGQVELARRVLGAVPPVFSESRIWPSLPVEKRMAAITHAQSLVKQAEGTPGYEALGPWSACWTLAHEHAFFVSELNVAANRHQTGSVIEFFDAANMANQAYRLGALRIQCAAKADEMGDAQAQNTK